MVAQVKSEKELSGELLFASVDMFEDVGAPKVDASLRSKAIIVASWESSLQGVERSSSGDLQRIAGGAPGEVRNNSGAEEAHQDSGGESGLDDAPDKQNSSAAGIMISKYILAAVALG